jgi:hypothetical protein
MGAQCHSIRATECSITSTIADSGCALAYALYSTLRIGFLLLMCNTPFLAVADTLHDLLHVIKSIDFWNPESSFGLSTIFTSMVTVRLILSS